MLPYHVSTLPHVSSIAPPPLLWYPFPLRLVSSEHLLYINPLYLSIQINLIISYSYLRISFYILIRSSSSLRISSPTNSPSPDFRPTPVSDLLRNYRTYPLIIRVGTTHKLKPSPTRYPLPIIPLTQLRSDSEPVPVPPRNRSLTPTLFRHLSRIGS